MRLLPQQCTQGLAYKPLVIDYEDLGWYRHIAPGKARPEGIGPGNAMIRIRYIARLCNK
jgi:hypothetical protein